MLSRKYSELFWNIFPPIGLTPLGGIIFCSFSAKTHFSFSLGSVRGWISKSFEKTDILCPVVSGRDWFFRLVPKKEKIFSKKFSNFSSKHTSCVQWCSERVDISPMRTRVAEISYQNMSFIEKAVLNYSVVKWRKEKLSENSPKHTSHDRWIVEWIEYPDNEHRGKFQILSAKTRNDVQMDLWKDNLKKLSGFSAKQKSYPR